MAAEILSFPALQSKSEDSRHVRKDMKFLSFYAKSDVVVPDKEVGFLDETRMNFNIDLGLWVPFGMTTPDGMERDTDIDTEEAESYNDADFVRKDMIKAAKKIRITLLQDKTRVALEKRYGLDLSNVVATPNKGFSFDEPTMPMFPIQRLLFISLDFWEGDQSMPIYGIDLYTRTKQTSLPKESKNKRGYPEIQVEYDVFNDAKLGTPCRHWIDGAGYDMSANGFKLAA